MEGSIDLDKFPNFVQQRCAAALSAVVGLYEPSISGADLASLAPRIAILHPWPQTSHINSLSRAKPSRQLL